MPDAHVLSLPRTFRDAVRAEFGRALRPPYATLSTVAANGAVMSVAWFFLPRALKDDVFTLHGSLAFALVLAAWMYSDVPATNVLAPDRQRVCCRPCTRSSGSESSPVSYPLLVRQPPAERQNGPAPPGETPRIPRGPSPRLSLPFTPSG